MKVAKGPDFFDMDFAEIERRVAVAMAEGREGVVDYPSSLTGRRSADDSLQRMAEFTRKVLSRK